LSPHDSVPQIVPMGYFWQLPAPSHFPFVEQAVAFLSTHTRADRRCPWRSACTCRRRGERAALAGPRAVRIAAQAVDAVIRRALRRRRAGEAEQLRSALGVDAGVSRVAVRVRLAGRRALARGAQERGARLDARRLAGAEAVARSRRVALRARAGGRDASRLGGVLRAAAEAVALARRPARHRALVLADGAGSPSPSGCQQVPRRFWQGAGDAAAAARDVAAHAVGAEGRGALGVLRAVRAVHLEAAAAVDAGLARDALGALRAGFEAGVFVGSHE